MSKPKVISLEEHGIEPELIDIDARKVINRLQYKGFAAYAVGGCVRDLLLHKKPKDFDLATDAKPSEIAKIFANCRIIGKRFKLVQVFFRGRKIIELATFRSEETNDEDEAERVTDNCYGTIKTDAQRRDLTINSLYYNPETAEILDFNSGYSDLKHRSVKTVISAEKSFEIDPVRILRTIRHAARTGFSIGKKEQKMIVAKKALLVDCPQMRIFEELAKDFSSGYLQEVIEYYNRFDLTDDFFPALAANLAEAPESAANFRLCLKGIDRLVLEKKMNSYIPILATIALFSLPEYQTSRSVVDYYKNQGSISDQVDSTFDLLHVPKKARYDVDSLLKMLFVEEKNKTASRPSKVKDYGLDKEYKLFKRIIGI